MSTWSGRLAVFDLETTGVDVDTSRIVSACVAVLEADGSVVSRWDWLADPGIPIPEAASEVHGITTQRAQEDGRPATLVVAEITQTLRAVFGLGIPLVVYNAPYDLSLLDRECRRHRLEPIELPSPVIDPLVIDKALDRYRKGKRTLVAAAERYGVALDDAHDAGADAIAAGRVAQAMARSFPDELELSLPDLHGRQEIWYRTQAASFQDYIRTTKGDADFVADASWPLRPLDDVMAYEDTQPIPVPDPRPGRVPILDFSEFRPREIIAAPASARTSVAAQLAAETTAPSFDDLAEQPFSLDDIETAAEIVAEDDAFIAGVDPGESPDAFDEQASFDAVLPVGLPLEAVDLEFPFDRSDARDDDADSDGVDSDDADAPGPAAAAPDEAPAPPKPTVLRLAAAIVTDPAGRNLLVRKAGTSVFMQPGGKIEPGESALTALTRELSEELGIEIDQGETEYIGSFRAEAANEENTIVRAEVFYLSTAAPVAASGEIEELLWIEHVDDIAVEIAPLTRESLLPLWIERRPSLF